MACWVVPAVAAELWGIGVQQVLDRVADGELRSKRELGFVVVDIAPDSPVIRSMKRQTWVEAVVSEEEAAALAAPAGGEVEIPSPEADDAEDFYESGRLDWRTRRLAVSRTRRRPGAPVERVRRGVAAA